MATWYNAQILGDEGRYCIQFETGNYEYFKMVEKACQNAIDKSDEARDKCSKAKDIYVPTNADHIRAMTDEELAVWIAKWCRAVVDCDECPLSDNCPYRCVDATTLDWLKQPSGGADHE